MQQTTDSTVSYAQAEDSEDRQSMIEYYVDQLLRRIAECPYDSIPQLFQYVTRGGPCLCQADVLRLFGGQIIFRRTCRRMNLVRRAALNCAMDTVPVDLRTWAEQERPEMDPPFRDYRYFWRPNLNSPTLFWYETENMEEEIYRYPAVLDTDGFFQETGNSSQQTNTNLDDGMEGSDWFGAEGPINAEYFWEPPSESWITDTDRELLTDGSDDDDWRRPPPINAAGLEWYSE